MAAISYNGSQAYAGTPDHDQFYMQSAAIGVAVFGLEANDYVRGGPLADYVEGGAGADYIYGGRGADTILGGAGDDVLSGAVDNGDGTISKDYTPDGSGTGVVDHLLGGEGNDLIWLTDMSGDIGYGGAGNDVYRIELGYSMPNVVPYYVEPGVIENPNEGVDTVVFVGGAVVYQRGYRKGSYELPDNVEILILGDGGDYGGAGYGWGNALDNTIIGNTNANGLYGDDGNDGINGAEGNDDLHGGNGNDTLYGGTGTDRIDGGAGNDALFGDAGADTMAGGAGNDIYSVDDTSDTVIEGDGDGYDEIHSSADRTLPFGLETLFLIGSAQYGGANDGNQALIGNEVANVLSGGAGNDFINGVGGDDLLVGDAGFDEVWGGTGVDLFRLNPEQGSDYFGDFTPGTDKLQVSTSVFGVHSMTEGVNFFKGAVPDARTAAPAFLYSTTSGYLIFDPDGIGTNAQLQVVAVLAGAPDLQATDFSFF